MDDPGFLGETAGNLNKDTGRKSPVGTVGRRLVWLIVLGVLLLSGTASAFYGASKVGSHVQIELSCKLLALAQREGTINPRQRREVTHAAVLANAPNPKVRKAVERVHAGCRGVRVRL